MKGQAMKRTKTLEQVEKEQWQATLDNDAIRLADKMCKDINRTVPASVEGMTYARQYVLEAAIKILQERV